MQEEVYALQRKLEYTKLKLATDMKLRNQAEIESKALKNELTRTKLNLNDIKNSI
jgi:hypothetical protein